MSFKRAQSLAAAVAAAGGDPAAVSRCVAEFLDEFYAHPELRSVALVDEPKRIGLVEDAWVAAVAEHLARLWGLEVPAWTEAPCRFLERPHFAGGLEALKASLLAESPLAFRRRQIFVEAEPLRRARQPVQEPA